MVGSSCFILSRLSPFPKIKLAKQFLKELFVSHGQWPKIRHVNRDVAKKLSSVESTILGQLLKYYLWLRPQTIARFLGPYKFSRGAAFCMKRPCHSKETLESAVFWEPYRGFAAKTHRNIVRDTLMTYLL